MIRTTVQHAAAAPVWKIRDPYAGGLNAGVESYRFNAALRFARDRRRYPYNLEVVVPFAKVDKAGRPTAEEIDRLAGIEEEVVAVVADRAVLALVHLRVGTVGAEGDQRLVFYTDSQDWTAKLRSQLRGATAVSNLKVYCDSDPDWYIYRDMLGTGLLAGTGLAAIVLIARLRQIRPGRAKEFQF